MLHGRGRTLVAGLGAGALLLSACGGDGGTDEAGGEAGGSYSVYICEPEHLLPQNTNETCGAEVLNALFTPLVNFDPETSDAQWGEDVPQAMALSVESEDQQNWTITLKEGWTFHNGEPVDAQSFVRAWNAGAYSPNAYGNAYFFSNIVGYDDLQAPEDGGDPPETEMSGLEAVDDTTLEVELTEPFSQFPLTLGYTAFYPLPQAYEDDPKAFDEQPIGNGPFQMDGQWEHNQRIDVMRYEDYGSEPAMADSVEFRIYSDVNTAYNDLLAGNLDIMDSIPPERLAEAEAQFGDRYIVRPSSSFTYIGFPLYDDRFEDPQLRTAISMAIDREGIIDAIYNGAFEPAGSVVSPVVSGAREDPCGDACDYNPDEAKEMFDAAGGFDGTLTLWFNSGAGHEDWIESVANQLRSNLGIENIRFKSLEFAEYLELLDNREITGPFRLGWVMDYPSPQNYLEPIYATGASSNYFEYSNEQVDQLIAQGNAAESIEEGIEFYHQAEDLILEDMPNVPMWFGRIQAAHSDRVGNVTIDAFQRISTADVTVE